MDNQPSFWSMPAAELLQQLKTTSQGLTNDEARRRVAQYGERLFGFTPLPISFLVLMGVIVALYIASAEAAKKVFYKKVRF